MILISFTFQRVGNQWRLVMNVFNSRSCIPPRVVAEGANAIARTIEKRFSILSKYLSVVTGAYVGS